MTTFDIIFTTNFAFMVFRVTTPILFTALGAMISRRAGIMNISLEGMMLVGALFGVIGSTYTQSATIGVIAAISVITKTWKACYIYWLEMVAFVSTFISIIAYYVSNMI